MCGLPWYIYCTACRAHDRYQILAKKNCVSLLCELSQGTETDKPDCAVGQQFGATWQPLIATDDAETWCWKTYWRTVKARECASCQKERHRRARVANAAMYGGMTDTEAQRILHSARFLRSVFITECNKPVCLYALLRAKHFARHQRELKGGMYIPSHRRASWSWWQQTKNASMILCYTAHVTFAAKGYAVPAYPCPHRNGTHVVAGIFFWHILS